MANGLKAVIVRCAVAAVALLTSMSTVMAVPVDPPTGSRPFLALPYAGTGISVLQGWYYKNYDSNLRYCNYQYDLPGARHHCAIDFVKRVRWNYLPFPVVASADGVASKRSGGGAGTYLQVDHTIGTQKWCTRYLHLDPTRPVTVGPVKQGQQIATAGKSGTSIIHLHWYVSPSSCRDWGSIMVDPFDIAGPLLRQGVAPTKEYYPSGTRFKGCGTGHLMLQGCPSP